MKGSGLKMFWAARSGTKGVSTPRAVGWRMLSLSPRSCCKSKEQLRQNLSVWTELSPGKLFINNYRTLKSFPVHKNWDSHSGLVGFGIQGRELLILLSFITEPHTLFLHLDILLSPRDEKTGEEKEPSSRKWASEGWKYRQSWFLGYLHNFIQPSVESWRISE